ncbi:aspartate/glutamate racemase family protein [Streptomyces sp. NBC_00083]|uniref:aspartate/glutamate racemase family protein n=1 Tax=Streptomyces sp. NBC_00083 TaxID=2975647 RepID=UPI0022585318|nr:amino acid racemase [Streptomyces sp. NBC_00083]MCX5388168.1 amino acid racemase [Streptomyces sp. NBC_00083]
MGVRRGRPTLGILGGMGPLATAAFYRTLVERTPAHADQAHLPVLIWADPAVPDRTTALLGEGPSPLPALVEGARWLQQAGATCIAVPCNTAHAYVEQVARATGAEVLDMIGAALRRAARSGPDVRRVGVLATRGTRTARLYEQAGERLGLNIVQVPDDVQRAYVDPAIRAVKAGATTAHGDDGPERWIGTAAEALRERGAQVAVAACTEIPLIAGAAARLLPVVDSADALVERALERLWRPPAEGFVPGYGGDGVISFAATDAYRRAGPNLRR